MLKEKVDDFLSQLVITLGRTNWLVTWIGHGQLTTIKLKEFFKKETDFQYRYAIGLYEEWYEQKIIDKSSQLMESAEGRYLA